MHTTLLLFGIGTQEFIFLALIVLLLFGGKKIPELMKGLGKGVKNFKDGINGIEEDIKQGTDPTQTKNNTENKGTQS